jgi:hypothetical protein
VAGIVASPPLLLELHACCLCWKLGYLLCILFAFAIRCWRIGKAPPRPALAGSWVKSPSPLLLSWLEAVQIPPPLPALAGSWVNESICPSECLLWLEAGVFPPFLLLAHNLIGIQQFLIVYDSTVT